MVSPFLPDDAKLHAIRDALPAVGAGIYLSTAVAGPLPTETAAAMAEIADHELRFGRAHRRDLEDAAERRDEARAALAAVIAADVGSVALTHGSRDALAVALRGVAWSPGDVLVTVEGAGTDLDAASAGLVERRGVRVVAAGARPEAMSAIAAAAADPAARLVALPHVTRAGRLLPIADIARSVRERRPDVPIVVDGRLAVGAFPVVVDELGVDAYALAGDAWLLGPAGTGALWLAPDADARLRPDLAGEDAIGPDGVRARDVRAFEPGVIAATAAVGLARSAGWLSMYVGLDWVLARAIPLAARVMARLAETDRVELLTPTAEGQHGPVVAFRLAGWPSGDVADELGRRVFVIAETVASGRGDELVRLSLACFNEPGELDRVCDAIELLAAHTPETLPRRTALTILSG